MKKLIVGLFIFVFIFTGCQKNDSLDDSKLKIVTTVYPLEYISKEIVKDNISVKSIYPKGADIHSYELSSKDLEEVLNADLFIGISSDLEPFIKMIKESVLNGESDVKILEIAKDENLLNSIDKEDFLDYDNKVLKDYHLWTSPKKMAFVNEAIYNVIIDIDNNKNYTKEYLKNKNYLMELDQKYSEIKTKKTIFVSHAAFYWLEKDYGIKIRGVDGNDHHDQASAKEIKEIIDQINKEKISVIFTTTDDKNNKQIKQIANETNTRVDMLADLESFIDEETYFDGLENNLNKIKKADL